MKQYAKKTSLALLNPYKTVIKVFPETLVETSKKLKDFGYCYYIGIKDTDQIPRCLISSLSSKGFVKHTLDAHALGGRAIDVQLVNPLTGNWMTGSSSGSALNVLYNINDIGIGTDGGGSVLGPAISLNLYGFISKLIVPEEMSKFSKTSTDNITFSPSIGYITRDLESMIKIINSTLDLDVEKIKPNIFIDKDFESEINVDGSLVSLVRLSKRKDLFDVINKYTDYGNILISKEEHIDVEGFGDSVFGLHDELTESIQKKANKGLIRVVNIIGKTCIALPTKELSSGIILVCNSDFESVKAMLEIATKIKVTQNKLSRSYFGNLDNYFKKGYQE